jgi:hypothetical protein
VRALFPGYIIRRDEERVINRFILSQGLRIDLGIFPIGAQLRYKRETCDKQVHSFMFENASPDLGMSPMLDLDTTW